MTISTTRTPRGASSTPDIVNEIANPSWETNNDFWTDLGWGQFNGAGTTIRTASSFAFAGGYELQKRWTTAATVNNGFAGISTIVPWGQGLIKTFSVNMACSATDQRAYLHIDFLNASGTVIGGFDGSRAQLGAAWTRLSATATAPAGTTNAVLKAWITDDSPGHSPMTLRFDGASLVVGALTGYFDGDSVTGADGRAYKWGATPHASNSFSYPPDPASNVLPTLYQLPGHGAASKSIVHDLLGGGIAVILRDAGQPDGILRLYFTNDDPAAARAAAYSAFEQHRKAGTWILVDDANTQSRMQYLVQPGGRLQLLPNDARTAWWLEVPYRKLSDAS